MSSFLSTSMLTESDVRKAVVDQLVKRTESLFDDIKYSDLSIKCGERTFVVHKAVVCAGCDFFLAACKQANGGGFKETTESTITLSTNIDEGGDDSDTIALVTEYLYKTDYFLKARDCETQNAQPTEEDRTLTAHAKVFAAADKFQISKLKMLATFNFNEHTSKQKSSVFDVAEAIRVVFSSTLDSIPELRDTLKQYLLRFDGTVTDRIELQSAVENVEGLAYELFKMSKGRLPTQGDIAKKTVRRVW